MGDDDQSIYSWRGAEVANFDHFSRDFPERLEIKLEQNYRSTGAILAFANAVISANSGRRPKNLWSSEGAGAQVVAAYPDSDADEAEWIVQQIRSLALGSGLRYADCAVLVRANNLTRALEEVLLRENIAYQVSGGMSFFSRREVARPDRLSARAGQPRRRRKHAPHRQHAAARPGRRRPGAHHRHRHRARLLAVLGHGADRQRQGSRGSARARAPAPAGRGAGGTAGALRSAHRQRRTEPRHGAGAGRSGRRSLQYRNHLLDGARLDAARWKLANVDSVIDSLASFEQHPDRIAPTLADYLARTALVSRDDDSPDRGGDPRGRVQLMTIHAAKGLEFDTVFIAGADDGSIPHARSLADSEANIEEERRLFYVAATRARRRLFITCPAVRRRRGPGGRPEEYAARAVTLPRRDSPPPDRRRPGRTGAGPRAGVRAVRRPQAPPRLPLTRRTAVSFDTAQRFL